MLSAAAAERELKCLRLSASGQTSGDIGMKLGIKLRTVNFHFSKILRKLNAMNRQEAIAKAASANLLK
jgi:DNA-binding CsgD family transcriptional regulator